MSLEQDLSFIKERIELMKTKKIESESTLNLLDKEKAQLLSECLKLGVDPKKLADEIIVLEAKLQKDVSSLKAKLDEIDV